MNASYIIITTDIIYKQKKVTMNK